MSNASGHPAPRRHPHDGNGTKEFPIELDVEGSEIMGSLTPPADEAALTLAHLTDFTCAICLDAPPSITDVASISGCTHTFCFDCIDKWADTENRCPCCKARFRTIDRMVALPPSPPDAATSTGTSGIRSTTLNPNLGTTSARVSPSDHSNRRLNSRSVEDRSQPSMATVDSRNVSASEGSTLSGAARRLAFYSNEGSSNTGSGAVASSDSRNVSESEASTLSGAARRLAISPTHLSRALRRRPRGEPTSCIETSARSIGGSTSRRPFNFERSTISSAARTAATAKRFKK